MLLLYRVPALHVQLTILGADAFKAEYVASLEAEYQVGLKMKAQAVEDEKKAEAKLIAKAKHIRKMNKEFQEANIKLKALKAREADAIAVEEAKIKVGCRG